MEVLRQWQVLNELVHFFEFQNEAGPSLDQLNAVYGAPLTFHLAPSVLSTWLDKVYTFI